MLHEIKMTDGSNSGELSEEQLNDVNAGLVVISIIGIVVGLLLPAVNRA